MQLDRGVGGGEEIDKRERREEMRRSREEKKKATNAACADSSGTIHALQVQLSIIILKANYAIWIAKHLAMQ